MKLNNPLLLLPLAAALLICACKKNGSSSPQKNTTTNSTYYVKLKINGTQKEMTYNATSLFPAAVSFHTCELAGQFAGNNAAGVTLVMNDADAFTTTKTYTEQVITLNNLPVEQCTFTYKDDDNTIYLAGGTTANTKVTVNFTEIASDHVKGTFSGKLLNVGSGASPEYATITDGEFNLSRSQ